MNPNAARQSAGRTITALLGSASMLAVAGAIPAVAQGQMVAQADEIPETVLITGSLIRGTAAVGVPVIGLTPQDFAMTGTLTASDLFRNIPQFNVAPGPVATQGAAEERGVRVNLRQLDTGSANRSLMMIDGLRYPSQSADLCQVDPSIIPTAAIERIDLLLDGASATYGSDAIGGVINVILKRNFDGAMFDAGFKMGAGGNVQYLANATWGRTWDGGQVTLSYSWFDISPTHGNFNSKLTFDHRPWGLDDRRTLGSSYPGTVSTGAPRGLTMPDPNNPSVQIPNPAYPGNRGTNCQNCYAIPLGTGFDWQGGVTGSGPLLPGSAPTINWATLSDPSNAGANGTRNVFNPYSIGDYSAAIQYTGGAITVDQRLTRNISFYGSGLYGMRRSEFAINDTGHQVIYSVPTFNPYYPTGAPNGLRVAYHMGIEAPPIAIAYSMAQRYQLGLNIALPADWAMQVYFSHTKDKNHSTEDSSHNNVTQTAVSAALGWTIPATPAAGTTPGVATWTKPSSVPYLNLFCDPRAFTCNSPETLNYLNGIEQLEEYMHLRERGVKADGPLFDLPGGTVKMAIGASMTTYNFLVQNTSTSQSNPTVNIIQDPRRREVWAAFTQVNIPIFSDQNALPLLRRLEFEASWRHDQYSDVGGTSNAKLAFNWNPIESLTIRGGWGQSFRAPNFGEFSEISNVTWDGWNLGNVYTQNAANLSVLCASGTPREGSGADKMFQAGFGCDATPGGLSIGPGGKVPVIVGLRDFTNTEQKVLDPEKSINWAIGFDFTPTRFLTGLNIQATYYIVKINGILRGFNNPTNGTFNDPSVGFSFVTPEDLRDPLTDAQLCPGQNATPALCEPFQDIVRRSLSQTANEVPPEAQTLIYWVNDGGTMNLGYQTTKGVDFQWSYDWEWEGIGAFNTGMIGTYYIEQPSQVAFGGGITDFYHTDLAPVNGVQQLGVESRPRFKYRARVGWSDGTWSVTAFMDYAQHFYHTQPAPPNVNNACITPGGTVGGLGGGYTNPCAISDYTNHQPSYYTFDLSLGYNTGDRPANEYLRNVSVQLVVQNIMDRDSPYAYKITSGGGLPCACDVFQSLFGRMVSLRLQKTF
jgi:outer membrane receptor protein involved in Fe transport